MNEIEFKALTYFMITMQMYFPFLICEMKCSATVLIIADHQNTHNITIAVKAFVEFFKTMKHEKELNRKIFIFFISHNHISVRIYSHYSVINGNKITYYHYSICTFDFTEQKGREK